ncbi:hypothetical protein ADZ36_15070 [Streptomyces fradiae]|uniref:Uncharacterized protein n=1 Tax=Streptomyces fradiae TaxID=1906 RepID=A0ACC4WAL1_STRFR|nr:hypothetical protein ADZ36_15070 [Streptomyces fradiae]OFA49980.1 hypothetical protein BEN35_15900 [Streptomyces fradiae]
MAGPARPDGASRLGSPQSRSPRRGTTPDRFLAPGGHPAITCFAAGAMGSQLPDAAFYRQSGLHGGSAYTPESLCWIFSDFTETELRRMRDDRPSPRTSASPPSGRPDGPLPPWRHDTLWEQRMGDHSRLPAKSRPRAPHL